MVVALNAADEREAVTKNASESTLLTNAATATKNSFELERPEARLKTDTPSAAAATSAPTSTSNAGNVRVLGTRSWSRRKTGDRPSVREVDEAQIEHDAKRNGGKTIRARSLSAADVFAAGEIRVRRETSTCDTRGFPVGARRAHRTRQFERW